MTVSLLTPLTIGRRLVGHTIRSVGLLIAAASIVLNVAGLWLLDYPSDAPLSACLASLWEAYLLGFAPPQEH